MITYPTRVRTAPQIVVNLTNYAINGTTKTAVLSLTTNASSESWVRIQCIVDKQIDSSSPTGIVLVIEMQMNGVQVAGGQLLSSVFTRETIANTWLVRKPAGAAVFTMQVYMNGSGSAMVQRSHTHLMVTHVDF